MRVVTNPRNKPLSQEHRDKLKAAAKRRWEREALSMAEYLDAEDRYENYVNRQGLVTR